jgi:radical SAM protein with 4Fe4S-binding SPASM domain
MREATMGVDPKDGVHSRIRRFSGVRDVEDYLSNILGENYISYREEWIRTSKLNEIAPNAPVHLDIEMQDYCNQSCIMCPRNTNVHTNLGYQINEKHVIDLEKLKNVIFESIDSGVRSLNFGAFSEPLIHSDLWELIEFAHSSGIVDTRVITNGLLLNRWKNQIFDSGLVNLFISLDAFTESTYEKIRGKGFNKVIANTLEIIEERKRRNSKLPIIRVSWVDMAVNRNEKEEFVEYWKNLVDHVDVQNWSDFTNVPVSVDLEIPKAFDCRSPWQRLSILANGDVLPCCDFNGRGLVLGNIAEDSLSEIWQGEKLFEVRKNLELNQSATCSACQRGQGAPTGR